MGVRPGLQAGPISPAEMEQMVARAGLVLNPGQMADLVLVWRQVVALLALIPRDRPIADDLPGVFRLPEPRAGVREPARVPRPKPVGGARRAGKPAVVAGRRKRITRAR